MSLFRIDDNDGKFTKFSKTFAYCLMVCTTGELTLKTLTGSSALFDLAKHHGPGLAVSTLVGFAGAWTALKLKINVVADIQVAAKNGNLHFKGSHLSAAMKAAADQFLHEHADKIAYAVEAKEGVWLVRQPGADQWQSMSEREFKVLENKLAKDGDTINKVILDDDSITLMRMKGGKLHGPQEGEAALVVYRKGSDDPRISYYDHGDNITGRVLAAQADEDHSFKR
jgi:hypothetical protein